GRTKGQHLPHSLLPCSEEIDEFERGRTEITDPIAAGQRGGMKQNAAGSPECHVYNYNARAPMSPFRYGRDFYTDEAAQQLLSAGAWLLIAIAGASIAVHMLRRSTGHPVSNTPAAKLPPDARVLRYQIGARLYHWGNTLLVIGLAATGV